MKKNLVLIDDELDILETLEMIFETTELYNINSFNNPIKALDFISKNNTDCIICDINMPQMNGFELLKKYRTNKNNTSKFIFFTGHGEFLSELDQLKSNYNVDDIFIKPEFDIIEKVNKINFNN